MAPPPAEFERARSAEAKRIRETAILDAAARLAAERGVRAVTLTDIAAAVGMHKSAMLRYFETREEIFLRLAASEWTQWSRAVRERLAELGNGPESALEDELEDGLEDEFVTRGEAWSDDGDGNGGGDGDDSGEGDGNIAAVAGVLADSLVARPLFCDLLAHTPLNLERGVSFASVRSFKTTAIAEVNAVSAALCEALPLTASQASSVVATATSMAGAFWQMAAPGTELRRFYEETPELAHAVVDVGPRLAEILTALLRGYCAGAAQ
jgi:AcrR family transcriptional regulator